ARELTRPTREPGSWGTVDPSTPETLILTARVESPDPQTDTATISHATQFDPDPSNNTASATETPQHADLAVTKTVNNARPNVGDTITFTLTLTDIGPNAANNVTLHDLLPAGLNFVSASPSLGTYNSASGVCIVGTVTTSTRQTLLIRATVVSPNA